MTIFIDTPILLRMPDPPLDNDVDLVGLETEITLPDATILLEGRYLRAGDDLVITAPDGTSITVEGYFTAAVQPILTAPNGALLLPETVNALLVIDPTQGTTLVAGPTMVAAAPPQTQLPSIGKVKEMMGTVMAKGGDGVERALKEGDPVYQGEVLQTQKGGLIKLILADGTVFQLGEAARAILDKFIYDPEAGQGGFAATVTRGIFSFESGAISGLNTGRHSTIKTPTAVIGIRGSQLSGEVQEDGSTTVVHTAGILDISDAKGQGTVTLIEPGTATQVVFGAGAPEPVFKAPANFISRLESQLDIHKVKEEQKSEDRSGNQEQKPEGKPETPTGTQDPQESKTDGGQSETKKDVEGVEDAENEGASDSATPDEGVEKDPATDPSGRETANEGTPTASPQGPATEFAPKNVANVEPILGNVGIEEFSLAELIGAGGALQGADVDLGAVGEVLSLLTTPSGTQPNKSAEPRTALPNILPAEITPPRKVETPETEETQNTPEPEPELASASDIPENLDEPEPELASTSDVPENLDISLVDFLEISEPVAIPELTLEMLTEPAPPSQVAATETNQTESPTLSEPKAIPESPSQPQTDTTLTDLLGISTDVAVPELPLETLTAPVKAQESTTPQPHEEVPVTPPTIQEPPTVVVIPPSIPTPPVSVVENTVVSPPPPSR
ncbi:MAG TPA: hypothetical protein HPQ00_16825, partial [Magnetococcales bacterium]|nr:hypothetical protein [Magnetococcales bacterium]